ncbi:multi-sensor domain-containing diguanylate cyclase [Arcobacter venerupis]|uniref:diguanylate cyclase n=1 Tax=Arcobacter venerupis TaxID=1054033 RepID=A0AAE7BBN6_9BACT|nr:diguanylate cyclase [Arcobacter venerupis]QKF67429.1 multi-sensor domain-containing diguanylate cyclase [Arcobacter venerupis]
MQNNFIMSNDKKYNFSELVDIAEFEEILISFYKATGIPNALVGKDGKIIFQTGWIDACALFHRANIETNSRCLESNYALMENVSNGKVSSAYCKNGLIDYATPIVIEDQILATLFLGQVLNEAPNIKFFQNQAQEFNYDETEYLKAIKSVPIISKEKMKSNMDCVVRMAQILAKNGLAKLRESELSNDLHKSTKEKIQLKDILDFSPVGISWSDINGDIEYVNHKFIELFGYTLDDIPTIETWYKKAYSDLRYQKDEIKSWHRDILLSGKINKPIHISEREVTINCKDGSERRVLVNISWLGEKCLANFNDITEHWKSELRNRTHDSMLEMVAKDSSLSDILHTIVKNIELEDSASLCSILLLDKEGKKLLLGASPSLPDFYNNAINGTTIGLGVGSCGTAAFLASRVIVEDITTHEYWKPYKGLALKAGLISCWSEPIISSIGNVLGTFAIYHKEKKSPTSNDIERITFAANLAAIAIENRNARKELEHRAYSDYLTGLSNRRYFIEQAELELSRYNRYSGELSLLMFDIDFFKKINDTYGHNIGDLVLQKIADISRMILRDIDILGRIGGEEFAVLLPETNLEDSIKVAERMRIEILNAKLVLDKKRIVYFTASFGVVAANNNSTIDDLLIKADKALYKAKNAGRNRVCTY